MNDARIEHVGIVVGDLELAVRWYADWFGAREMRRFERADFGIQAATLQLGDTFLEAIQPSPPPAASSSGEWPLEFFRPAGAHHLAIAVADLAGLYARMKAEGIDLPSGIIEERLFFCRDPFGTRIEVRQKK